MFIVYSLSDPRTGEIRYIGKSTNGLARAKMHIWPSVCKKPFPVYVWVRELLDLGLKPSIGILEQVDNRQELNSREKYWIASYRSAGASLTNATEGGEGSTLPRPKVVCEKIRIANLGHQVTEFTRQKLRAANLGKRATAETRAKMSASHRKRLAGVLIHPNTGRKLSAETRERMRQAHTRRMATNG